MPYIKQSLRKRLDSGELRPATPGELNYEITKGIVKVLAGMESARFKQRTLELCRKYVTDAGTLRYQVINDVVGAIDGAKMEFICRTDQPFNSDVITALNQARDEFYAEVAVPYETKKCAENGDVY